MEYREANNILWPIKNQAEQDAAKLDTDKDLQAYFLQRGKIREFLKAVDDFREAAKKLHAMVNTA